MLLNIATKIEDAVCRNINSDLFNDSWEKSNFLFAKFEDILYATKCSQLQIPTQKMWQFLSPSLGYDQILSRHQRYQVPRLCHHRGVE